MPVSKAWVLQQNLDVVGDVRVGRSSAGSPGATLICVGDGFLHDLQDWYANGAGINGLAVQPYADAVGLKLHFVDSTSNNLTVYPTGLTSTTRILIDAITSIAPTVSGVALKVTGDTASNDIQDWYVNGGVSPAVKIDEAGNVTVVSGVSSFKGVATAVNPQTSAYIATANDHTINCDGTFMLTLDASGQGYKVGQEFYIKNIGTGTITVEPAASSPPALIDNAVSISMSQHQSRDVQWDGSQWWIMAGYL